MAFVSGSNGKRYFSVFFFADGNDCVSGTFHELTERQWENLSRIWIVTAAVAGLLFFSQLLLYFMNLAGGESFASNAWKFYLLAVPLAVIPPAIYIAPKPSVMLHRTKVSVSDRSSYSLYAAIFCFVMSMSLSFLWMAEEGIPVPGISLFLVIFSLIAIFCACRWRLIAKFSSLK